MSAVIRTRFFSWIIIIFLYPFTASGLTIEEMQIQIQGLLNRVETLKVQLADGSAKSTSTSTLALPAELPCLSLSRSLFVSSRGEDVRELQKFLIAARLLDEGSATGYFGFLSESAVQKFQTALNIVSFGTAKTTGFGLVGLKTRSAILKSCTLYDKNKHALGACPNPPPDPLGSECAGAWEKGRDAGGCFTGYQCVDSRFSNKWATTTSPTKVVPSIAITEPVLGGIVTGGNTLAIEWRSEAYPRARVTLSLIDIEGKNIGTIASNLPSSGKYAWSVPSGGSGCSKRDSAFDCIVKFTRCEGNSSICSVEPGTYFIRAVLANVASTTSASFQIAGTAVTDLLRSLVGAPIVTTTKQEFVATDTVVQGGICTNEGINYPVGATLSVSCVAGHCFSTGTGFINGICKMDGQWCIPYTSYCNKVLTLIDVSAYEGGGATPISSGHSTNCPKEGWRAYFSCPGGGCQGGYNICRGGVWILDPNQRHSL